MNKQFFIVFHEYSILIYAYSVLNIHNYNNSIIYNLIIKKAVQIEVAEVGLTCHRSSDSIIYYYISYNIKIIKRKYKSLHSNKNSE